MKKRPLIHEYLELYTMFFWLDVVTWAVTWKRKGQMVEAKSCKHDRLRYERYIIYRQDSEGTFYTLNERFEPAGTLMTDVLGGYLQDVAKDSPILPNRFMVAVQEDCSLVPYCAEIFDVEQKPAVIRVARVTRVCGSVQG